MQSRRKVLTALSWLAIVSFCLISGSNGRAQDASAEHGAHTYYMFVFSRPVAGKEDEFNRWYSNEHALDVTSIPGFVSGQRFVYSDVQLRKDAAPPRGLQYMIMYKIVTSDLSSVYAEVKRRLANGMTRMSPTYDTSNTFGFTYEVMSPAHKGTPPTGVAANQIDSMPAYLQLVLADPQRASEDEFNQWYDTTHFNEMLSVPGFLNGQRSKLGGVQLNPDVGDNYKYLAVYEIASRDIAATIDVYRNMLPSMHISPAFRSSRNVGYTYKAIGPVINGDQVRAERKKSAAAQK